MAVVPQETIVRVSRAYAQGHAWLLENGHEDVETVEVALAAQSLLWYWKPEHVRTIVVGDFRRVTRPAELSHRVKVQWMKEKGCTPPDAFVRTPYCLGFGEPELVPTIGQASEEVPEHWPTLARLTDREPYPAEAPLLERLEWKVLTLRALRERGIWLAHPTLHGSHAERPLIKIWWDALARHISRDVGDPAIVAVGKELFNNLTAAGVPAHHWFYRPQTKLRPQQREHQEKTLATISRLTTTRPV